MKHPLHVNYEGGLERLAVDIGNLRYDALVDFLERLSGKLAEDATADRKRERIKLSGHLGDASTRLLKTSQDIKAAWKLCAPFEKTWVVATVTPDMCVTKYFSRGDSSWVNNAEQATTYHKEEADKVIKYLNEVVGPMAGPGFKLAKLCLK
jgi:hypothetical protein